MKIYIVETRNGTKVIYNENKLVKLLSDDSSGYLHSRGYCVTPDRIKDCFNTVKSEIVN